MARHKELWICSVWILWWFSNWAYYQSYSVFLLTPTAIYPWRNAPPCYSLVLPEYRRHRSRRVVFYLLSLPLRRNNNHRFRISNFSINWSDVIPRRKADETSSLEGIRRRRRQKVVEYCRYRDTIDEVSVFSFVINTLIGNCCLCIAFFYSPGAS